MIKNQKTEPKTGMLVKVVKAGDEMFPREFLRKTGRIVKFDNTECGATPKDPMIIVEFAGGKRDGFWSEELEMV